MHITQTQKHLQTQEFHINTKQESICIEPIGTVEILFQIIIKKEPPGMTLSSFCVGIYFLVWGLTLGMPSETSWEKMNIFFASRYQYHF